jgi:glucoside 3-dehydrogenase (cytochrome c) hitch-hiker subunit
MAALDLPFVTDRRAALAGLGGLAALWAIPTVAAGQGAAAVLTWTPKALTPAQARTLDAVAELIVPATDTPGARAAGVPPFVDRAVDTYCTPADAAAIRAGLDRIEADARAAHGGAFADLAPDQQASLVAGYDAEGRGPRTPAGAVGRGETETGLSNQPRAAVAPPKGPAFFPILKDLVTVGYFTSELGATKAVRYDPVPGAYHGCVPLKQIGRAWAT